MATATTMTAEQLLEMPDDGYRYELIDGELRQMSPTGTRHAEISAVIARILGNHVTAHRLGKVLTSDPGFILRRGPDTVRAPDVAFIARERVAGGSPRSYFPGPPDLAVEVISP
jgi:Uma2 family endonuclease